MRLISSSFNSSPSSLSSSSPLPLLFESGISLEQAGVHVRNHSLSTCFPKNVIERMMFEGAYGDLKACNVSGPLCLPFLYHQDPGFTLSS